MSLLESMTCTDIEHGIDDLVKSFTLEGEDDFSEIKPAGTDEIQELRDFMTHSKTLDDVSFRLVHENHRIDFKPHATNVLDRENGFDRLILGEGARYCKVALAAYSWMLYIW